MHSVAIPGCQATKEFVRGSMYSSGYLLLDNASTGVVDVRFLLQVDLKGNIPNILWHTTLQEWIMSLDHLKNMFRDTKIYILGDVELKSTVKVDSCFICRRKFNILRRQKSCRICGEVGYNISHNNLRVYINVSSTCTTFR